TPGGFVGQADMADLAGAHQVVQYLQGILYGSDLLLGVVLVAELAEEAGVPGRPVQLIEIDMLGLQAPQTALQCSGDVLTGEAGGAVADMVHGPARPGDLGGEDPPRALATLAKQLADDALAGTLGFAPGRYRVHLRAVDEVDAGVARTIDLGKGIALGVLLTPGHGAQAQGADLE